MYELVTIKNKKNEAFLREKTVAVDFSRIKKSELRTLVKNMRMAMKHANGVGLSANQIGLSYRLFVAQVPDPQGKQKFYAIANPELVKVGTEMETLEEGCLSIPEMYGPVPRNYRVVLTGFDMNGKKVKIKAWGLLARVFQHEMDHLNGKLFIDRADKVIRVTSEESS